MLLFNKYTPKTGTAEYMPECAVP